VSAPRSATGRDLGAPCRRPDDLPRPCLAVKTACHLLGLALCLGPAVPARSAATTWKGGAADLNWSTGGNWLSGLPTSTSDVIFATNAVVTTTASNNVVSTSATVQSLTCRHTNSYTGTQTYHHTYIRNGMTLTISSPLNSNALFVGSGVSAGNLTTRAAISGTNGSLVVLATNGVVNIRQGGSLNYNGTAVLDLSGLSNCTVRAQRILVGADGTNTSPERDRASGTLKLARNNYLYLYGGSFPPALTVGYNIGNGGTANALLLGQTNYLYTDSGLGIGMGRAPCILKFGGAPNSIAVFRDAAGSGPQAAWLIGDSAHLGYWGNYSSGTNDFSGGTVDAQVALLVVGRSVNGTANLAAGGNDGALLFDAGTIQANTVVVGYQLNDYCARVGGVISVDGTARLQVNNAIQLGRFMGFDPTNGVSSAALRIGTLSGGGTVTVNGGITTGTSTKNSTNFSQVVVRNGGALSVKGAIGPLSVFELNAATLGLDFGAGTNPPSAVCSTTNLLTGSPVTVTIAGTGLAPGQITLIKYRNLSGAGFAAFTRPTLPSHVQGYLSNNVAASSIDLVITQSSPLTNLPPLSTPRLRASPPVYADYGKPLTEAAPRADGYTHVDTPALVARLREGHIKTYAFLVWMGKTDWDDFRLEFLPAAQAAGLDVWLYLTPPSENSPPSNYTPFGEDYYSWLSEAARLAQRYPALKAVVMDDFNSNLGVFTPDYVRRITDAAHAYDSNLMFMVINYDLTKGWASPTSYTSPAFMNAYGPYCGAIMFAYLNWASHDDYTDAAFQIANNSDIIAGKLAQLRVAFPSGRACAAGDYAAVSQVITNGEPFPDAPWNFKFRLSDYPQITNSPGYFVFQVLVDGAVAWSRDESTFYGVLDITTNLQPWIAGKTAITLTVRMSCTANLSSLRAGSSWNLPAGNWTAAETGAFAGTSTYYPATTSNVPMIIMIYDWKYGTGGDNSPGYVYEVNGIAQAAVQAGQAAGIIQFSLDKSASSPLFPVIQELYGQWAYQPRFRSIARQPDGTLQLSGDGGGPTIGYTVHAADAPGAPAESWNAAATGAFDATGTFTNSDLRAGEYPARFFRLTVP
jgi:hypothetical protein